MEVFCRKEIGQSGILEYKMTLNKQEHEELGSISVYGMRVKYCAPDDFRYYNAENVSSKPQRVLQIIKHLFDRSVMPEDVYAYMQDFMRLE